MTRRLEIRINANVYLPDGIPVADYLRAVANHLADVLPSMTDDGETIKSKTWRAGRDVGISADVLVMSEALPPFPDAAFADLQPEAPMEQGTLL